MAPPLLVLSALDLNTGGFDQTKSAESDRALAERAEQLLIHDLPQVRPLADVFRNLAFATCEISEQTGSASKTKHRSPLS
jgi:hypothetical protein